MKSGDMMNIETDRLILRPYHYEDYDRWYEGFSERYPSQYKYDVGKPKDLSRNTEDWFKQWINGFNEQAERDEMYVLGIFRKEDGANVGKVELVTILRMDYDWAMMGYSIHNQYWKRGYGTESVRAFTSACFKELDFHRIELHINPDNTPSVKLAQRSGFHLECKRESFKKELGKWQDMLIFYQNRQD
ncbi:GNAT family N-acetyltransferase [Aquisalibacillus elongatus]|uniref:RimJ/RimL family protein N-acetyltransferase n=1 Tax=Aquisalibacillus elongatus TaxID=485577 RepID=A0A3N5C1R3_9BACI|nr:GNAT family N-acetyltransferase [Aquisalibacillus elongatus]RPF53312.1 RimJ/RimL family protein N-acetyltransferase [Aquisalibacillus elongatus]